MTDYPSSSALPLAQASDPSQPSNSRVSPRKKASTACSACRARRSKCTGGVPCQACVSHRTTCVIDVNDDGRRRVAIKRRIEGYEEDRTFLELLIAVLKYGDDSQLDSVIRFIRTDPSRQKLRDLLETKMRNLNISRGLESGPSRPNVQASQSLFVHHRQRTGSIGDLINPPVQVPAQPWTQVTHDDDYVSHLISLWFTWMQPWFRWVEEDNFTEAMRSQDLNSPLCSPYLVNSILAEACLLDTIDEKDQDHNKQMRQRFMAEATAGIQGEHGKPSLTLVQALGVQWTHLYLNGQDTQGRLDFSSQSFLLKNIDKWRARMAKVHADLPVLLEQIDSGLQHVSQTFYSLNFFNLGDCYADQHLSVPKDVFTGLSHEDAEESNWTPYAQHRSPYIGFHPDCHYRGVISLAKHMAENEELSQQRRQGMNESERLEKLLHALEEWPASLPQCIQLHAQAMPHVLILHALHNWVLLVLAKQAAAAEAGHPGEPTIIETPNSGTMPYWRRLSTTRALTISAIMQDYRRYWGVKYFPALVLQPVALSLLTLLESMEPVEHHEAFVDLSKILKAISHRYRVGRGVIRVIRTTARSKEISMPAESEEVFGTHQTNSLNAELGNENSPSKDDDSWSEDDITMDYLLGKWEDLDLEDDIDV